MSLFHWGFQSVVGKEEGRHVCENTFLQIAFTERTTPAQRASRDTQSYSLVMFQIGPMKNMKKTGICLGTSPLSPQRECFLQLI